MLRHCQLIEQTMVIKMDKPNNRADQFIVPNQTDIWLFFRDNHVEIWDFVEQKKLYQNRMNIKRFSVIVATSKTTIIYVYTKEQYYWFQQYNILTGQQKYITKMSRVELHQIQEFSNGCFFRHINSVAFYQSTLAKTHIFLWNINKNYSEQQNKFDYYKVNHFRCDKYDDYGKFSITEIKNNFKLIQKQKEQIFTFQEEDLRITEIKRYSDVQALVSGYQPYSQICSIPGQQQRYKIMSLTKVIFFNIITKTVRRVVLLEYPIDNIVCIGNYWVTVQSLFYQHMQHPELLITSVYFQNQQLHKIQTSFNKSAIHHQIDHQNIPLIVLSEQLNEFKIKTIRLISNKKIQIINLLQKSQLVEIFGNEIVKQVINNTI